MKKLLIVNGSPRKNGSCATITQKVSELASKFDYETENVFVYDLGIGGCKGCNACKKSGSCVQKDCMNDMIAKIRESDMVLFATPVYYAAETGPLKTFVDRLYPMTQFNEEGQMVTDVGKVSKGSVLVAAGAPNGNMLYANVVTRFIDLMRKWGVIDVSGAVIPAADQPNVLESDFVRDYLGEVEFQLEM